MKFEVKNHNVARQIYTGRDNGDLYAIFFTFEHNMDIIDWNLNRNGLSNGIIFKKSFLLKLILFTKGKKDDYYKYEKELVGKSILIPEFNLRTKFREFS